MLYDNKPFKFTSDPGKDIAKVNYSDGTSRYYVYTDGMIRVKFKAGFLYVRPGKNLCYLPTKGKVATAGAGDAFFTYDSSQIAFATAMDSSEDYQKPQVGKSALDFLLDKNGKYKSLIHTGHPIILAFDATINGNDVDEGKLDAYVIKTYGKLDGSLSSSKADVDLRNIESEVT